MLGVEVLAYYPDYYGALDSVVNRGLPTDRLLCEWHVPSRTPPGAPFHVLKIPLSRDIDRRKEENPERALRYQSSFRSQCESALSRGFGVPGFTTGPEPAEGWVVAVSDNT